MANASFFWTACVGYYVHRVVSGASAYESARVTPYFHLVSWGYPIVFAIIILAARPDALGADQDVPWCFIPREYPIWRVAAIYLPLGCCWIFTALAYFLAFKKVTSLRYSCELLGWVL